MERSAETPAGRLLGLLSLLQARPSWTAEELAERMDVTTRTVRRSVARLRDLGYPVNAEPGPFGGYQLGAGAALPPLLLTDDEAAAVVVGLQVAAGHGLAGYADAAVAALAKLEQVMPAQVRERVTALHATTLGLDRPAGPSVSPDTLVIVAQGCRRLERVRFDYTDGSGRATERFVEPYQLVHAERRWYLVAHDPERAAWRTFRLDRMAGVTLTGHRFVRTDEPDAATLVADGIALNAHEFQAVIDLAVPMDQAARSIPRTVGVLGPVEGDDRVTRLRIGGDLDWVARYLVALPFGFRVVAPDELRIELTELGARLQRDHA